MAANKNGVKIGLRVLAVATFCYLIYNFVPAPSAPLRSGHKHADDGFVKDSINTIASPAEPPASYSFIGHPIANSHSGSGQRHPHLHNAVTTTLSTSPKPTVTQSSPSQNPSKWASATYSDTSLPTPIKHLTLTNNLVTEPPSILVCVMTKDASSWGDNSRNFSSFLYMLEWTELNPSTISLAFLTSSEEEFETYRADTVDTSYASVHLILHPGYRDAGGSRGFRHSSSIQHARRVEMARLRNYATLTSLGLSHQHVLWIDSDVYELSTGLVQSMLKFSAKYPQVGIQTAISLLGDGDGDYDWNAWQGERTAPDEKEREKLRKDKGSWTASGVDKKSKHMGDFRDGFKNTRDTQRKLKEAGSDLEKGAAFDPSKAVFDDDDDEPSDSQSPSKEESPDDIEGLFRLDAVGATVLMMKASLWRQGLAFATSYLVGTDWKDEGWDGVESEGLCVSARNLINEEYGRQGGIGCWGLAEGYSRHSSG